MEPWCLRWSAADIGERAVTHELYASGRNRGGSLLNVSFGSRQEILPMKRPFVATSYNRARMRAKSGKEIVVGVSGASGAGLAIAFLRLAANRPEFSKIHLIVSETALSVARAEAGGDVSDAEDYLRLLNVSRAARSRIALHSNDDLSAPISSGSYSTHGMVVIPCSAGTLASIAAGISRGLLQRAADVTLKEKRPLVLAFRESPYSLIHLENMERAARAGATIMPPSPPFYIRTPSAERMVEAYCFRVARVFGVEMPKEFVWTGPPRKA